jgi:hypothetical protein
MNNKSTEVNNIPEIVQRDESGDFVFELNTVNELRISNKFNNTTYVLQDDVLNNLVKILSGLLREELKPQLFQLHHQSKKDFSTKMISQSEIYCQAQMNDWWKETAKEHPLPEGFQWLICNEDSEHFVKCAKEG